MGAQPVQRHHQQQTDPDPADRGQQELGDPLAPAHPLPDRGGERHPEGGDRRRVVHQRLTLKDGRDAGGQPDPARDRGGRHGVRRRDDRPQDERGGERQLRDHEVRQPAHRHRREEGVPHGEQRDRPDVGPQIEVGAVHGRRVEQRWQQQREHHVRVEVVRRDARQQTHDEGDGDQDEQGRNRGAARRTGDRGAGRDQCHQRQRVHLTVLGSVVTCPS